MVGPTISDRVLVAFDSSRYHRRMTDSAKRLTPATPADLVAALAYALRTTSACRQFPLSAYRPLTVAETGCLLAL
jgi:hypothetical protein